ncbi:TPA: oxaloacetate decarboxylase subunit alpha [Candidatus Acetothermia bacterium]|nr:oxaloacetate decarboxylase subunit alpha [Candidatus Acetothermia bacterium]
MVRIIDTTLRDGHQSLIATRLRTEDMTPVLEKLDAVGFYSLEVWGGATFDACLRFLAEDPWDRLRQFRAKVKQTKLQMLLRGQNLVGYRPYADDVVEKFVELAVGNGIDIIRVFDALNDMRNMTTAIKAAKKAGAEVQGAICYTTSPVHTVKSFAALAREFEELGVDVVCIKDMAGIIAPNDAYEIVSEIKRTVQVPVDLHTHMTSGMGALSYYAACQAGVDIVDCAFSPFAGGAAQPPLEPFVASLRGTPYDTLLDLEQLLDIGLYFLNVKKKYQSLCSPVAETSDVSVLVHQVPGGMISNLYSQLKEQKALHKYSEILKEVPRVREDLGYPPLVTPTSQIVGTQAVLNVLQGERYKKVTEEVKNYCLGLYGRTPAPIQADVLRKVIGDQKAFTGRPADALKPELEDIKKTIREQNIPANTEEDVLSYALYPQIAAKFLRGEAKAEPLAVCVVPQASPAPSTSATPVSDEFVVTVDDEEFRVRVRPVGAGPVSKPDGVPRRDEIPSGAVVAPMQGMVVAIKVKPGDAVTKGDTVVVLEAMKMQTAIQSDRDGKVHALYAVESSSVDVGDVLLVVQ